MSLFERKKRPIKREAGRLRDDRIFYVACDDTYAPKQYFDSFAISRIKIHVVPTEDGGSVAKHVMTRLEDLECDQDDERWMLLDTDHCTTGTHLPSFLSAIKDARKKGIRVALSKPCFEIWLLLHHLRDMAHLSTICNAADAERLLREAIGEYNKTRLKAEHYPLEKVMFAFENAVAIDSKVGGGDVPDGVTTRVYQLWQAVVSKALPSQLPIELQGMLSLAPTAKTE